MRIVAGRFGGRVLEAPKGRDIRPTSDKVRGAMFNALRSRGAVERKVVLDAFCGSGALGLEALSQGAVGCTFIDKARDSLDLTRRNAQALGADEANVRFILRDVLKIGVCVDEGAKAHLIFLDPPYSKGFVVPCLDALAHGGWIADGAWVVCETEKDFSQEFPSFFDVDDEKAYGDTKVYFLRFMR